MVVSNYTPVSYLDAHDKISQGLAALTLYGGSFRQCRADPVVYARVCYLQLEPSGLLRIIA